jgi:hypothetical protein
VASLLLAPDLGETRSGVRLGGSSILTYLLVSQSFVMSCAMAMKALVAAEQ